MPDVLLLSPGGIPIGAAFAHIALFATPPPEKMIAVGGGIVSGR